MRRTVLLALALALALPAAASAHAPRWIPVPTGSDQQFRGLDAVDRRTAWVGGSAGQVLRTTDGGAHLKARLAVGRRRPAVPRRRGGGRPPRERAGDRRGPRVAHLHHCRR